MRDLRVALLSLFLFCSLAQGQQSFRVELGKDGETIGDMRPVFLKFETKYIALFADQNHYAALAPDYRNKWREFSRFLADYHYAEGDSAKGGRTKDYALAARYYEGLARRSDMTGELFRLAGDARLQAREYPVALKDFRIAAYDVSGYQHSADAGWAAIVLVRGGLIGEKTSAVFKPGPAELAAETDRFTERYDADSRNPGLLADLAARWLEAGNSEQALHYATQAVSHQ